MADAEISVSVERAMHDGLAALAQSLADKFGVRLNSAQIEWINVGTIGEPRSIIGAVRIDSTTDGPQNLKRSPSV